MYRNFYSLKKKPFHITPDPEFLFLSPSHREALASIIYGIEHRKGFLAITGEVGVGKTTILRAYLEKTGHDQHKIIYIFNAAVSFGGLLKLILNEFGEETGEEDAFAMVNRLHHLLIGEYQSNRNVILLIDEAQNMPIGTLENLRMLSNLETSEDKLIQILLVGQPELERILNLHELRQLSQRIAVRCRILPLTKAESYAYIQHRLAKASDFGGTVFAEGVLKPIVKRAKGIPRVINILCDNALVTGFGYQKNPISKKIIKEIVAEYGGQRPKRSIKWWPAPVAVLAMAILLLFVRFPLLRGAGQGEGKAAPHKTPGQVSESAGTPGEGVAPVPPIPEEKLAAQPQPDLYPVAWVANRIVAMPLPQPDEPPAVPLAEAAVGDEHGSVPDQENEPLIRTVKQGDCLANLIKGVYGYVDDGLLAAVMKSNPQIKDINLIKLGDRVIFPRPVN